VFAVNFRLLLPALLLVLIVEASFAAEPTLQYRITGLTQEALENAGDYLGSPPDSVYERSNFLFSARKQVEQSLNALGYYHPVIEMQVDREKPVWQLLIRVDPGARVHLTEVDVRVDGEAANDPAFDELLEEIPLVAGGGLHHGDYEDFKENLLRLARARGYFEGEFERHQISVDVDTEEAVVELHYDSGERYHFGEVTFDEFPLQKRRLQQLMTFAEGDVFDIDALQSFQADLQRTEYFGEALVQPLSVDSETNSVPLHVKLEPGHRNHYRLGLGYSSDTRERISLSWRTPRINRMGHRQTTLIEYSPVRPRARLTYSIPLTHPLDDTLQASIRIENNEYGSLESRQKEIALRREMLFGDWVFSGGVRRLREDWEVGPQDRYNNYLLPGVSIAHTTRGGNPLDPERGFSQLYTLEVGEDSAGSDITLQKIYVNWKLVYTIAEDHRLVGRAELGAVNFSDASRPDLAPSLSFFAGGSQSIRGYAYQSLGPKEEVQQPGGESVSLVVGGDRLAVASAEYQYYVRPDIRAAVFVDGGNAFNGGDMNPVVGAGFGVHYVSPVGAIRLDLANSVSEKDNEWRVHITMGAEF
jgi:translocation and assembly module TamA